MKVKVNSIILLAIIFYILIYELVFFFIEGTFFQPFINFFKLGFPFVLLFYKGFNPSLFFKNKQIFSYLFFYLIFLFWLIFLNIYNSGFSFGFLETLRQIPRFIFLIGLIQFFLRDQFLKDKAIKGILIFALFTVLMHIILLLNPSINHVSLFSLKFAGPFGILGSVSSRVYVPNLNFPIYRLTGWFNEPSNASAFLYSSYFLAKSIQYKIIRPNLWEYTPKILLIGGILTFSNAGYIALGGSFIILTLLNIKFFKNESSSFKNIFFICICISVVFFGLLGRKISAELGLESDLLSVLTGNKETFENNPYFDPTSGRLDLISKTTEYISEKPQGSGFQNTVINIPAGAPFFWLLLSGIPGLILLLSRESIIILTIKRTFSNKVLIYQYCALIALMFQQSIYGQWNNAFYYFLVGIILVENTNEK